MSVLKFFLNRLLSSDDGATTPVWIDDPLRHPALMAMSPRELSDLPLSMAKIPDDGKTFKPKLAKCV